MTPSSPAAPDAGAPDTLLLKPKFGGVALVCGDCQKRGNGPSKLKAKDVRKALKRELGNLPVRMRVMQCTCLGLCPKKAMALTAIAATSSAPGGQVLAGAVRSDSEARAMAAVFARSFATSP